VVINEIGIISSLASYFWNVSEEQKPFCCTFPTVGKRVIAGFFPASNTFVFPDSLRFFRASLE